MVELRDVWRVYRVGEQAIEAVRGVNLSVAMGEFVCILGHSGSGKSTLLSMIGGLARPTRGTVSVQGTDLWSRDDDFRAALRNRTLGFVFQFASLIPTLTAIDNVALPHLFNVARIHIPPLRERAADLAPCVQQLLREIGARRGRVFRIAPDAMALLAGYPYPGNVRELHNAIEWAVAVGGGDPIEAAHLPDALRAGASLDRSAGAAPVTLEENERELIARVVADRRNNLSEAARALGIGRTTLWRKMKNYGIAH